MSKRRKQKQSRKALQSSVDNTQLSCVGGRKDFSKTPPSCPDNQAIGDLPTLLSEESQSTVVDWDRAAELVADLILAIHRLEQGGTTADSGKPSNKDNTSQTPKTMKRRTRG
jgi:hypothetical protein